MTKKGRSRLHSEEPSRFLRLGLVEFAVFLLMAAVTGRLFQVQVLQHDFWFGKAEEMSEMRVQVQLKRGEILDRNGETLATSLKRFSVFMSPKELQDEEEASALLSYTLGVDREVLMQRAQTDSSFAWVKRHADPEERTSVEALRLQGVGFQTEYKRVYPQGELGAQVIGFVGVDSQGLEGLERQFDRVLGFHPSWQSLDKDGIGRSVGAVRRHLFSTPEILDLELTLDIRAQHILEKELRKTQQDFCASTVTGIVLDPKTGEILAVGSVPGFDPNQYDSTPSNQRRNKAITDLICPGSTFKMVPASIALENGLMDEERMFFCENGRFYYYGHWIDDVSPKGWLTFPEVLINSSNVGVVKMASEIPPQMLYEGIRRFGFGSRTDVYLPGEVNGVVRPVSAWSKVSPGELAIGQEVSGTPLQIALAYAAVANGGLLMRPLIAKTLKDPSGDVVKRWPPEVVRRVISQETASRMKKILARVVAEGSGRNAAIPGYIVAGKTGTAQKFDVTTGRFSPDKFTCLFVGFLPVEDPQVVILVVVDEPEKGRLGGLVAAPGFARIGKQLALLYGIEPEVDLFPEPPLSEPLDSGETVEMLPVSQEPQQEIAPPPEEGTMPDVSGLTMSEALKRLKGLSLDIYVEGSGVVVIQNPAPGAKLDGVQTCAIVFSR